MITGMSAALGFHFVLQRYTRSLYNQSANLNHLYSSVLSGELSRLISSGGSIATDPSVQSLLLQGKAGGSALDEAKHFLSQSVDNRITGVFLYDEREPRIALGNTGVSNEILSGLVRRVLDEAEQCWVSAGTRDGSVLMGRRILSSQPGSFMQPIGVLILRVNINRVLLPQTGSSVRWDKDCYIALYHDGSPVYPAGTGEQPPVLPDIGDGQFRILSLNGREYFVTMSTMEEEGNAWQLVFGLPYGETVSQIAWSRRMVFAFIAVASLLAFVITAIVMHRFTQNYTLLVSKMDRFKRGEYQPEMTAYRNTGDELVSLNRTFDEMAVSYERMTRENYEKQLLLMQARLKNLENQLDPHFLFNTLETISYFAKRSGEEHIPQVVTSLAELLQYSLRGKSDCVPLSQETDILEKYLYIQKLRFSDILTVSYDFDERTLSAMIPKMTLQPLAENAIRYTLEEEENCVLRLSSRPDGDDVLIFVADNGPVMEKDLLQKLRSGERQPHGSGIGLQNVDTRHKLLFGDRYGLTFDTIDGMATVIVRIPAGTKREGDTGEDVQNGPC